MPDLIIVRGVPGSGKTTLANECAATYRSAGISSAVVSADDWMVDGEGKYAYDYTQLPYCHTMCQRETCRMMTEGVSVIFVANTFVRKWEAEVYLQLAKLWGYTVTVYRMTGEYENVHGVPADKVAIMKANMEPYSNEVIR
jgi:predicted kinase